MLWLLAFQIINLLSFQSVPGGGGGVVLKIPPTKKFPQHRQTSGNLPEVDKYRPILSNSVICISLVQTDEMLCELDTGGNVDSMNNHNFLGKSVQLFVPNSHP